MTDTARRIRVPLLPASVRWAVVLGVAGTIAVASVLRPASVGRALGPLGLVGADKWAHALGYAGLALALAYALQDWQVERTLAVVFLAAVAFGLAMEGVQATIPYRSASLLDATANAVGATLAVAIWLALRRRVRFRPRRA